MIADLVVKQQLPAIYSTSTFVRSGGLIGYGFDRADLFQRAAGYVDRIFKGESRPTCRFKCRQNSSWRST